MATKKTTKKATGKTTTKKTASKKATAAKKPAAKKAQPSKGIPFQVYDENAKAFQPADKAKAVKVPGFDDFQFFLHKSVDGRGWTISEASSGGRISVGRTQKEAKEKAAEALGKHGKGDLLESIKRSIAQNGAAPGFEDAAKATGKDTAKQTFSVATDDGTEVEVIFDAEFRNHLEFRGEISPTGYRSHFGYDGKVKVEEAARKIANDLRAEYLKEQAKQARKGKKQTKDAQKVTTRLKSRILAALVDDKKLPRNQVHFDDIAETTGAPVGDVAATLMVLELEKKVKSLPGKFYRLPKTEAKPATQATATQGKGGHAKGKMSMLDAAVEILKGAKQPLCCKEIVTAIFEKGLASSEGRTPHATLSAAMGREITKLGKNARFRRVDRGLYERNA